MLRTGLNPRAMTHGDLRRAWTSWATTIRLQLRPSAASTHSFAAQAKASASNGQNDGQGRRRHHRCARNGAALTALCEELAGLGDGRHQALMLDLEETEGLAGAFASAAEPSGPFTSSSTTRVDLPAARCSTTRSAILMPRSDATSTLRTRW